MRRLLALLTWNIRLSIWVSIVGVALLYVALGPGFRLVAWRTVDTYEAVKFKIVRGTLPVADGVRVTALVDVNFKSFDLTATSDGGGGYRYGAIEQLGPGRLLLGTDYGQFFLVDVDGDEARTRKIPLRIENNRQQLVDYAAQHSIRVKERWIRLDDLLLFDDRRQLAVSYSQWDADRRCVSLRVAVRPVPKDWAQEPAEGWREIFRSEPCLPLKTSRNALAAHQSGGRLIEGVAGKLLVSVGDFEFDGLDGLPQHSQDAAVDYGKILEIDLAGGSKRIVSSGHRNPQGLVRDHQGRIWSSEHGPRGGDELNLIAEGENYGWPQVTLGVDYGPRPWPLAVRQGRHGRYRQPAFAWLPSIGTNQLIEIRNFADEWDGDLLLAGMEVRTLFRIRLNKDAVQYVEAIPVGNRVRDLVQDDQGTVWMWTDEANLLRMRPQPGRSGALLAHLSRPAKAVVEGCLGCHDLSTASSAGRIPLAGVASRRVASVEGVSYTQALKAVGGVWTPARLDAFIAAPDTVAPGTAMSSEPVADRALRAEIVNFLAGLQ